VSVRIELEQAHEKGEITSIYSVSSSRLEFKRYLPGPAKIENLFVEVGEVVLANAYKADRDEPFCVGVPLASTKR
jgi:hypothetical protein